MTQTGSGQAAAAQGTAAGNERCLNDAWLSSTRMSTVMEPKHVKHSNSVKNHYACMIDSMKAESALTKK